MAATYLKDAEAGTPVKVRENGVLKDYFVMRHGMPTFGSYYSGPDDCTWVVRDECPEIGIYDEVSAFECYYPESPIDTYCTETLYSSLTEGARSLLTNVTLYLVYGQITWEQSTLARSIFVPSDNEVEDNVPQSILVSKYNGESIAWWTRNVGYVHAYSTYAMYGVPIVTTDGTVDTESARFSSKTSPSVVPKYGYRPVIVFSSDAMISDEGEIVSNTPPVITGTDGDLGTFGETSPTYTYTVTDPQGGAVSVTEALDGVTLRTYDVTLGQENTLTIPADVYRRTLNGTHTLTITATDSVGAQTVRTLTFTKNVTSCAFTLTDAFPADDMPTRCVVNIQGAFPEGSTLTVQICNNGNDASPTWETITQQALLGQKYFFQNKTKTAANWGVKVQASLERGTAEGDCYISSIGGVFQ